MKDYRQGAFRNSFEQRLFETVRDAVLWCATYAADEKFPHAIVGDVYHNVQTTVFHGELSTISTFAPPQTREIDVLVELSQPQHIRLLVSGKDSDHRQSLEHVGDYEGLLSSLRATAQGYFYWGMIVARRGFQSGCEETAKRADIALVPPITGSVTWLSLLTEEEVLERVTDAIKIFTLGNTWRRSENSYQSGDVNNSIFVGTREPSGLPGKTLIQQGDGLERSMSDFIGEAIAKPENRFRIPLSRGRTYIPFFAPPMVQSKKTDGTMISAPVASTIVGPADGIRFFRVQTESGRELIVDGQRALYAAVPGRSSHQLVRVDCLRVGTRIVCVDQDQAQTRLEVVSLIQEM